MKTLQIGLGWFPEEAGGLNRYYYDCSRYLPEVGIEFKGLVTGSPQIESDTGAKIKAFAATDDLLMKRWLGAREIAFQLLVENQYDLIVSHFTLYSFPILNLIHDIPLVTHFHGPWALESEKKEPKSWKIWLKKQIEKTVYRHSSQFIVLSHTFGEILYQEYKIPLEKINVIPAGVDIDRFNINLSMLEARNILHWQQNRPTIFCVRRLARRMGLKNLIRAMVQVRHRVPNVILYLAGKGALTSTLQAQINELDLSNNVQLLGYISEEELPLYYRGADFSVVPTISLEGFGLIIVESLAAGTPVLGTPIGGIPEILRPFSENLVFEGVDSPQLASGIIAALSGDLTLPNSQACLDYVQENYNWRRISEEIKLVYQKALN